MSAGFVRRRRTLAQISVYLKKNENTLVFRWWEEAEENVGRLRRTFLGQTLQFFSHLRYLVSDVNAIASSQRRANFTRDHYDHYDHYGHYVWTKRYTIRE